MSRSKRTSRQVLNITGLILVFLLLGSLYLLNPVPSVIVAAQDDAEKDLKGFSEQMVRAEQARRALQRGKSYLKDKSWEKARSELNLALQLKVDLIEARYCLGLVERGEGHHQLAVEQFDAVYSRDPDFKGICLELAQSFLDAGQCGQAESWLKKHLEKNQKSKQTLKLDRSIKKCKAKRG